VKVARLLGINLSYENKPEWYNRISGVLNSGKFTQLNTVNLEIFSLAIENSEYREILRKSELNVVDGYPVSFFAFLKRRVLLKRICGSDFIYDLLKICEKENKGILLLGGTEHRNRLAVENAKKRYPEVNAIGYSPAFPVSASIYDDENLKALIEQNKPSAIVVCFGSPKQEIWIAKHREFFEHNGVCLVTGLGGAIDFLSGEIKRAPFVFRKLCLEWFWRCLLEPKRVKRYVKSVWVLVKHGLGRGRCSCEEIICSKATAPLPLRER
jgi:N-acetylglucosaminyldiphosphoundecaprenol N-acetyl-beta-D-mannosaminyltransferase